jgi:hypothetical protein
MPNNFQIVKTVWNVSENYTDINLKDPLSTD